MANEATSKLLLILIFMRSTIATIISIQGSGQYVIPGKPFTFTCTFTPSKRVYQKMLFKDGKMLEAVRLSEAGAKKCYNVTTAAAELCDPSKCSCSEHRGVIIATWTFLSITDARSAWQCKENNDGSSTLNLKETDPLTSPIAVIKGVGNYFSKPEGATITLQCEVLGVDSLAVIKWNCFGGTVTNTSVSGISRSNITLRTLTSMNGHICTCSATHPAGTIQSDSVQFNVTYSPIITSVSVQPPTDFYTLNENQKLGPIQCSADCNPECRFKWFGPHSSIINGSTLQINGIKKEHAGRYTCGGRNSYGVFITGIIVNVNYSPKSLFLKPLRLSYTINENQTLGPIQCSADCNPNCSYTWTGPRSSFYGPTLELSNIKKGTAGNYRCIAHNRLGSKLSANLVLKVNYPPSNPTAVIKNEGNFFSKPQGATITLQCEVIGGNPLAVINWNCFGGKVTNISVYGISRSNITFTAVKSMNGRICTCSATHPASTIQSDSVKFNVTYNPKLVFVYPINVSYTMNENQTVGPIQCSADCNPKCSYKWTGPWSSRIIGPILQIIGITKEQSGNYMCIASNSLGTTISRKITVKVNYIPKSITLNPPTVKYTLIEHNQLGPINCMADCFPKCTYTWRGPTTANGSYLTITEIGRHQEGHYRCMVTNSLGHLTSSDIIVTVDYGPDNPLILNPSTLQYVMNETSKLEPIECKSTCNPPCTYKWIKNGQIDKQGSYLTISKVDRSHTGIYQCIAVNSVYSRSSSNVKVIVHYAANMTSMVISKNNFTINENSMPTVTCNAEGLPFPIITLRRVSNNSVISQTTGLHLKYTFSPARCEDTGLYKCQAVNKFKPVTLIMKNISVLCTPRALHKPLQTRYVLHDETAFNITVSYLAYPKPTFQWLKIVSNGSSKAIRDGQQDVQIQNTALNKYTYVTEFVIRNLKENDFGNYILIVDNVIGTHKNVFTVNKVGKPEQPISGLATCTGYNSALITWTSGFNNGDDQTFTVVYRTQTRSEQTFVSNIKDQGQHKIISHSFFHLQENQTYIFRIYSRNSFGESSGIQLNCSTKAKQKKNIFSNNNVVVGVVTGSTTILILIVVVIIIFLFRRCKTTSAKSKKLAEDGSKQKEKDKDDESNVYNVIIQEGENNESTDRHYETLQKTNTQSKSEQIELEDKTKIDDSIIYVNTTIQ